MKVGGEYRSSPTYGEDFIPSNWEVELEESGDLVLKDSEYRQYRFDSSLVEKIKEVLAAKEVLSAKESTLSSLEMEIRDNFTGITTCQRDPTPEDVLFHKSALWLNRSSGVYFRFTDSMVGSMRWEEVSLLERMKPLDADLMQAVNDNFNDIVMK
jgi:hypothetical protein